MPQTIEQKSTLYDRDLNLWLQEAIAKLKVGDFQNLDVENLIEELEGLAGRDRRELESRLTRLIEHILKRCYVNLPECYRGWELTIIGQRNEIKKIVKQSPSLKSHIISVFDELFNDALEIVQTEYENTIFPKTWQFTYEIDLLLTANFWKKS
ncbi:MAG: DUF29 domain-containing protein [Pseudanabaena sp.]|nr:MAG: DUF29 domain-containing protein [Pseudanabaena sp.]